MTAAVIDATIIHQSSTEKTVDKQPVVNGTTERPFYGRDCRQWWRHGYEGSNRCHGDHHTIAATSHR